jgi:hypothetical protein
MNPFCVLALFPRTFFDEGRLVQTFHFSFCWASTFVMYRVPKGLVPVLVTVLLYANERGSGGGGDTGDSGNRLLPPPFSFRTAPPNTVTWSYQFVFIIRHGNLYGVRSFQYVVFLMMMI